MPKDDARDYVAFLNSCFESVPKSCRVLVLFLFYKMVNVCKYGTGSPVSHLLKPLFSLSFSSLFQITFTVRGPASVGPAREARRTSLFSVRQCSVHDRCLCCFP